MTRTEISKVVEVLESLSEKFPQDFLDTIRKVILSKDSRKAYYQKKIFTSFNPDVYYCIWGGHIHGIEIKNKKDHNIMISSCYDYEDPSYYDMDKVKLFNLDPELYVKTYGKLVSEIISRDDILSNSKYFPIAGKYYDEEEPEYIEAKFNKEAGIYSYGNLNVSIGKDRYIKTIVNNEDSIDIENGIFKNDSEEHIFGINESKFKKFLNDDLCETFEVDEDMTSFKYTLTLKHIDNMSDPDRNPYISVYSHYVSIFDGETEYCVDLGLDEFEYSSILKLAPDKFFDGLFKVRK